MRNLTAPKQVTENNSTRFDTGCERLVLYTAAGDEVRLHVGVDGFFYINNVPFGVAGMPPALHASMHATGGGDALTPAMIGAVANALLTAVPAAGGVPVLNEDGKLNPDFLTGLIQPKAHASSHEAGGSDEITPDGIGAVADDDTRLSDSRTPTSHASSHATGGTDALTPADIGAVALTDQRLTNARTPTSHASTHFLNGSDPISWNDVGAVSQTWLTVHERVPDGVPRLNDLGHIDVNLLPQNALAPAMHASTHAENGEDYVSPASIGAANIQHQHGNDDITGIDASKVITGTIDIARLPASSLERLKIVSSLSAMYELTIDDVQNGDTVQTVDTGLMYRVVDDQQLDSPNGYKVYTAGRAAAVDWSGVENKPTAYNPTSHASTHATGGSDAIAPADIGAPTIAQLAAVETIANQGVSDAAAANANAATAQASADSANANANTRALQSDFMALSAAVDALTARVTALEGSTVKSDNIATISGTTLDDGVGSLYFETK